MSLGTSGSKKPKPQFHRRVPEPTSEFSHYGCLNSLDNVISLHFLQDQDIFDILEVQNDASVYACNNQFIMQHRGFIICSLLMCRIKT